MPSVRTPKAGRAKKKTAPVRAARKAGKAGALTTALAEAAWSGADMALAQALAAWDEAQGAKSESVRAEALLLAAQALALAGRRRGLVRFGAKGRHEAFDPKRHELAAPKRARAPKLVRILVQGVARGPEILVKARAAPALRRAAGKARA